MKNAIVVADDSKIIQNLIKKSLEPEIEVIVASNGKEAVENLVKNIENYNIIGMLLDLNMPEYDGFTVLEYFKTNNLFKKFPVSIISGDDSKDTISRAFNYPIVDLLNKPFAKNNIENIIHKMIHVKEN